MYKRRILSSDCLTDNKIVVAGKAQFGLFSPPPQNVDIKGVAGPFGGFRVPSFLTNLRIKARLQVVFATNTSIVLLDIFDDKAFGFFELVTGGKGEISRSYHKFMTIRRRFVPFNTQKGHCITTGKKRSAKISWRTRANKKKSFLLDIDIPKEKGGGERPGITGMFAAVVENEVCAVNRAPNKRRPCATWISAMKGYWMSEGKEDRAIALMTVNRAYYDWRSKSTAVCALDNTGDRSIMLHLVSSSMADNDDEDNSDTSENVLILNGKVVPLPPVTITRFLSDTHGKVKQNIQDTRGMVDLSFIGEKDGVSRGKLNLLFMKTEYETAFGTVEGVLVTAEGEKMEVHLPCIVRTSNIRV